MSAFLPIQDPDRLSRTETLKEAQIFYKYNYTHVSPLALLDTVPTQDEFAVEWLIQMGKKVAVAFENAESLNLNIEVDIPSGGIWHFLERIESDIENGVHGLKKVVSDALNFNMELIAPARAAERLEDFAKLFRSIGLPPIAKNYSKDDSFAGMRVIGPNPVMIRSLSKRDSRLPLSDSEFRTIVPNDSFDAALAEGRLYLADYSLLEGIECGTFPNGQKYIYSPLALFVVNRTTKRLMPVAIQCKQQPGPENPIFTPLDGYNWLIAKTIVEIADGSIHEASTHLGRTHLLMEPFVVSTYRQLAPNHPLSILLVPHFAGTLAINEAAWKVLIAEKGGVDQLLAGSISASRGLAAGSVCQTQLHELYLLKSLTARGVDNPDVLPDYPYRDDALLYANAINDWVRVYLGLYYSNSADLIADDELQAWGREIASTDGGRIAGMPNSGSFRTIEEFCEVVSFVIFTCSVQHAAVNFPQYDLMSYVPNMPLAGYRPAPTSKTPATERDYLDMLPTLDMAELQMNLGYLLGSLHYSQLGQYPCDCFDDPRVVPLLGKFQQRLCEINRIISERNQTRRTYETLNATGIPQSINV